MKTYYIHCADTNEHFYLDGDKNYPKIAPSSGGNPSGDRCNP